MKRVLLLLLLFSFITACKHKAAEGEESEPKPVVAVKVAKVTRQDIASTISAVGTIYPREQATVSSKVSAPIAKMALLKNRQVQAGDILAELESRDLKASLAEARNSYEEMTANKKQIVAGNIPQQAAQNEKALRDAEANVNNARALYDRRVALYQQGGIAKKEVEAAQLSLQTAENDLQLARAQIKLRESEFNPTDREIADRKAAEARDRMQNAEAQLSYAVIRSPISGTVTDQFQYQGEFASPGAKLVTIMDLREVIVKMQMPEYVAHRIAVDDAAELNSLDLPDEHIKGRVSLVSKTVDPTSRTIEVWVRADNPTNQLRPGATARATLTLAVARNVLVVPIKAVSFDNPAENNGTVMVVDKDSIAHSKKIVTGIKHDDIIEVASGLDEGETVITEGNYQLPDGTKVELGEAVTEKDKDEEGGSAGGEKNANEKGATGAQSENNKQENSTNGNSDKTATDSSNKNANQDNRSDQNNQNNQSNKSNQNSQPDKNRSGSEPGAQPTPYTPITPAPPAQTDKPQSTAPSPQSNSPGKGTDQAGRNSQNAGPK